MPKNPERTGCIGRPRVSLETRVWARVEKTATCWLWTGPLDAYGYGRIARPIDAAPGARNHKTLKAHRAVYELEVGPIPEGLTLDHLCANRRCVNPSHLEPVSNSENVKRGNSPFVANARKAQCKRGHAFTTENTHVTPNGTRHCKACKAEQQRARNSARRNQA